MSKYTNMEMTILDVIVDIYNEWGDYQFVGDILDRLEDEAKLNTKQARGVLSSLVKKDAIYISREDDGLLSLLDNDYRSKVKIFND